jgi:hypothetical protein
MPCPVVPRLEAGTYFAPAIRSGWGFSFCHETTWVFFGFDLAGHLAGILGVRSATAGNLTLTLTTND